MPTRDQLSRRLERTEAYLQDTLLPFWIKRAPDPAGGFLSWVRSCPKRRPLYR